MAKKSQKPAQLSYEPVKLPEYQGYSATAAEMMPIQEQYADMNIAKQVKAQGDLTRNAFALTQEIAPQQAELRAGLNAKYQPVFTQQYLDRIDQADPTFRAVRDKLGASVASDLDAGYSLGDRLTREVEQGIRGSQSARGNWLGPAPTAAEVFAKGSTAIDLNNQRQANARGFLSTRGTSDLFSNFGMMEGYQPVNVITPQTQYIDPGAPFQQMAANQGRTNSLLAAYGANNENRFGTYDRQWDRYLYSSFNGALGGAGAAGGGSAGWGGAAAGAAGGALSGAAMGAATGAMAGGIGAIPGAIIGGIGGAVMGGASGYNSTDSGAAFTGGLAGGVGMGGMVSGYGTAKSNGGMWGKG